MTIKTYNIKEIASWLLDKSSNVKLPAIQRGFVWTPAQIENLWDSLFRDFPIGSFMLTREGSNFMIIDGQQRATAIALGFFNPWTKSVSRIGNAKHLPTVWLDMAPCALTDTSEFAFRVTTRSHPWGYQIRNNRTPLGVRDRMAAADMYRALFGVDLYTSLGPDQRLPFDASAPVPLCALLEAYSDGIEESAWWNAVLKFCKNHIPASYHTMGHRPDDKFTYFDILEAVDYSSVFHAVKRLLDGFCVPSIMVENSLVVNSSDNASENPTLFVRLNRAGTPLEGEELLYSIYKAIFPRAKDLVESIGSSIIAPSRIITLASRLVLSKTNGRYFKALSLVQFQKAVKEGTFREALDRLIGDEASSPLAKMIDRAICILRLGDHSSNRYDRIPDVIVKKFIRECPNGLLLILNWLSYNGVDTVTDDISKTICRRLYHLYWFGDLNDFAEHNWEASADHGFWSMPITNNGGYTIQPLVSPSLLEAFLLKRLEKPIENHELTANETEIWKLWSDALSRYEGMTDDQFSDAVRGGWANFLWRLLGNKDLIILAQRSFINRTFADFNQLEELQDTSTPWDWDHIYPNSWVYYQRDIDQRTKNWEWRIGNFRAMPLVDNRSENNGINAAPAARFTSPHPDYFIKDNDLEYWSRLKDYSKDDAFVVNHATAIILRSVNIYHEYLNFFSINFKDE